MRLLYTSACVLLLASTTSVFAGDGCGGAGTGDCFEPHNTPYCNDEKCCEAICAVDPFCCEVRWDNICVQSALTSPICTGICQPACDKDNITCVEGTPQFENSRFVGMLLEEGFPSCTAWIVAAPDMIMTNAHCIPSGNNISDLQVQFDYYCSTCTEGELVESRTFDVIELIVINGGEDSPIDFAVLRVDADVASLYGQAVIDPNVQVKGQEIYEIHHAYGGPKGYDQGIVTEVDVNACQAGQNAVSVISAGGASGSPVFNLADHCVSGVCSCGPECGEGFLIPMAQIWPAAVSFIENAGGEAIICGEGCGGPFAADLNGDNCVNGADLGLLFIAWGQNPGNPADLNGDGIVNGADLGLLFLAWTG